MEPNDLINTRAPSPRQYEMARQSWQSWDYYNCVAYPAHAFGPKQWPRDKGPFPTCLPYVQTLVSEGADFIFRNGGPVFSVTDNPEATDFINKVLRQNRMSENWVPLAEANGNQGALAVKWSINQDNLSCPIQLSFLYIPQECRVWIDPHDTTRVLMGRIQYPYRNLDDNKWYYYREEWTESLFVRYKPKSAAVADVREAMQIPGYSQHMGDEGEWTIDYTESNPYGIVPITVIRNKKVVGNPMGVGDCWNVFRVVDRIALTMHGEDRANQMHSEPAIAFKNADIENEGPLQPGEHFFIRNEDPEVEADVELLEPRGIARMQTHWTIEKWEKILWDSVGLSRIDPVAVTNKGNMTALAFAMTYAKTISTSDKKRNLWGESGMCVLLRSLLIGLNRYGGFKELAKVDEDVDVTCEWPLYFEQTDEDKQKLTNRTTDQVNNGFLPQEHAIRRIALSEKVPAKDIDGIIDKLRSTAKSGKSKDPDDDSISGQLPAVGIGETASLQHSSGVNNFTA